MKAGLITALVVVAVGGLFLWMRSSNTESSQSAGEVVDTTTDTTVDQSQPKSVTVTYTDKGYSPANIVINLGDSVVFKNESSSSFWPASDPHPTHTIYPEFDANVALTTGQSYTFTFTKTGTWGYHDHEDSNKQGSVKVK